jgi:beta-glucanase (GH16 family)
MPDPIRLTRRVTLLAAPVALARPGLAATGTEIDLSGHQQTFNEEFDSLDVSSVGPGTRWISHTPWGGNFGDAAFADPAPDFPFTTREGILRIEARKNPANGRWQAGLLASVDRAGRGFTQRYGYFEVKARMPRGEGVWPAFWLIGVDRLRQGSTHTAEIDILEHYGNQPNRYSSAIAVWDRVQPRNTIIIKQRVPAPGGILQDRFNAFGASVEEDWIVFYFNRREAWRTRTPDFHKQPMFILLNLALGSGQPLANLASPSFLEVDYVRAWRRGE